MIDCINRMGEDEEFSIDKDECEELIREMEQEETPENVDEAAEEPEETEDQTDEKIKPFGACKRRNSGNSGPGAVAANKNGAGDFK